MSCLVSVIIPVYNVEDFVDRCLFSILKQSYKNYEAIVVNDGSTDTSLQICKLYEKLDNRFKVYTKPNGGLSSARNYGLEQATGKYVTYVDSDDMLDIDYLKHLVDTAEKFSSDLVICDYALWWPQYQDAVQVREVPTSKKLTIGEVYSAVLTLKTSTTIATQGGYVWNKLFRFDLIKDIKFQEIKGAEDEIYMFSVLPLLKSACYINKPLYLYNQRGNSLVNRRDFFIQFLKSREKLIDLAKDAEILRMAKAAYIQSTIYILIDKIKRGENDDYLIDQLRDHAKKAWSVYRKDSSLRYYMDDACVKYSRVLHLGSLPRMLTAMILKPKNRKIISLGIRVLKHSLKK